MEGRANLNAIWVEPVVEADSRHLATACLVVPLLIGSRVYGRPVWGEWSRFCQVDLETENKLAYFRHLKGVEPVLVNKLIKAGVLFMVEPKKASELIDEVGLSDADAELLAAGVILVTIFSLVGFNHYRREAVSLSVMSNEELWRKFSAVGIRPNRDAFLQLTSILRQLSEYL